MWAENKPENLFSVLSKLKPHFTISNYIDEFTNLSALEQVNYVYADLKKYNLWPKVKAEKDDTKAKSHRESGNNEFKWGDTEEALLCYNSAILTAKTSKELALGYANRSACLYEMKKFQECVTDTERAFANNYSGNKRLKLMQRRIKAEHALKVAKPAKPLHENIPKISGRQKHPHILCAKNSIDIKKNEDLGTHIIATRNIEIGEVLSVENPFAFHVEIEQNRCDTCMKLCYNLIPCENCIYFKFCSEACKEAAHEYHKYECPFYGVLVSLSDYPTIILALRLTISAKDHPGNASEEEKYHSDRYQEFADLPPETDKRPVDELLQFAITAALIFDLLEKHTLFFDGITNKDRFKELIFRHLEIASLYKLGVCGIWPEEPLQNMNPIIMAWGMYSFSTLFKHSCCPNVISVQYGNKMVLRALKSIKKGEQCCVSYGVSYVKPQSRKKRQLHVMKHRLHFCRCESCENDWKTWNDPVPFKFPLYLDLGITVSETSICNLKQRLFDGDVDAAREFLPLLIQGLRRLERFEPWGNVQELKELVATSYRIFGNKLVTFCAHSAI